MQNIAIVGGTMLLLGLTTQAHAGKYVLVQNNGWRLPSASVRATAAAGEFDREIVTNYDGATFQWNWERDNANDNPRPAKVTLGANLTVGTCSCSGPDEFTSVKSYSAAYFKFSTGSDGAEVSNVNYVSGRSAAPKSGSTKAGDAFRSYDGFQSSIIDSVNVMAESSANAYFAPDASSNAGAASATLTSLTITLQ